MKRSLRFVGAAVVVGVAVAGGSAKPATAGLVSCVQSAEKVFAPWGDNANYTLAPNGAFESGSSGWSLSGARVVGGNNAYRSGSYSLSLPPGSSATSPSACVKLLDPSTRFFVRNTGSPDARLKVELRYRTLLGLLPVTTTLGYAQPGNSWEPSPKFAHLLDNLVGTLNLNGNLGASVQYRFTPVGRGASFQIDDLYVDPILQF